VLFARDADDKAVTADFDTWGHPSDRSGAVVGPWPAECCRYTKVDIRDQVRGRRLLRLGLVRRLGLY
jgi:hypothetical protein